MDPTVNALAITRDAYQAYGDLRDWKTYDDKPMPLFDDLPDGIRDAWQAATMKAIESYLRATAPKPGTEPWLGDESATNPDASVDAPAEPAPAEPAPVESPLEPTTSEPPTG